MAYLFECLWWLIKALLALAVGGCVAAAQNTKTGSGGTVMVQQQGDHPHVGTTSHPAENSP